MKRTPLVRCVIGAVLSLLTSCMVIDTGAYTSSRPIGPLPESWSYFAEPSNRGGHFFGPGNGPDITVNISRGNISSVGVPEPRSAFPFSVCTAVDPASSFAGVKLNPSEIVLEARGASAHAVLEYRFPDKAGRPVNGMKPDGAKLVQSCWNLGFGDIAVDLRYPFTIRLNGALSVNGRRYDLPPLEFQHTPEGKGVCVLEQCIKSH